MKTHQPKPHKLISWPDVYFTAEANRERFEDVTVVTLKSYLTDRAYDKAIEQVGLDDTTKLRKRVQEILDSRTVRACEHVDVTKDRIHVVIDCEAINEDTTWVALDMVASALEQLNGKCGRIAFGPTITYKATDIPWLTLH